MSNRTTENTKATAQAWRKKPRRFAPKSRLGCKTCKIRRVKCDLTHPSCVKCSSTGRTCDGYGVTSLADKTGNESTRSHSNSEKATSSNDDNGAGPIDTHQTRTHRPYHYGTTFQNLGSFMILHGADSGEEEMSFFQHISIKHLNQHSPSHSWQNTLMLFSQTVTPVREAAIALSLIHRNYLDGTSTDRMYTRPSSKARLVENLPLVHYNRSIRALLSYNSSRSNKTETAAITLMVCYLLICFDHLAGNDIQAMQHLRGGVGLSRSIDQAQLGSPGDQYGAARSGISTFARHAVRQIRRLDMQAVMFLVDWAPAVIQGPCTPQSSNSGSEFGSLEQAADDIQALVARVMQFYWELQASPLSQIPSSLSFEKTCVLSQLETWLDLFESMLQRRGFCETGAEVDRIISMMRLQQKMAWALLSSLGAEREMGYDNYLDQFQQCVIMAADVATAHGRFSGASTPTFTPEIRVVPILYIIGVKCRDPIVRRQAMSILRRLSIREGIWDSISAARVVERVIEIEEAKFEQGTIPNMEQIAIWQRVEALSWVRGLEQESMVKLDITYTFCAQEGSYVETLLF